MSATEADERVARLRALADACCRAARRHAGGPPARRDARGVRPGRRRSVAGGLAYAALIALAARPAARAVRVRARRHRPGDPGAARRRDRDRLPAARADFAQTALKQVSAGAVPSGIIALIGLLWASSRFYSALDYAIARIFRQAKHAERDRAHPPRPAADARSSSRSRSRRVRGHGRPGPARHHPATRTRRPGSPTLVVQLAAPVGSFVLFVVATVLVYRFVPADHVPARAWRRPALVVGLAARRVHPAVRVHRAADDPDLAALYGAIVAVFALLAWLSIGFNMLLIGAAWTRVRALARPHRRTRRRPTSRTRAAADASEARAALGLARAAAAAEPRVRRQRQPALDARLGAWPDGRVE